DYKIYVTPSKDFAENTLLEISKQIGPKSSEDVLISIGGDGTLNSTINGLFKLKRKNPIPFAHISVGSGNDFQRAFSKSDWQEILKNLVDNKIELQSYFLGRVFNKKEKFEHYFINSFGTGFDADVVANSQKPGFKKRWRFLSYYVSLIMTLKNIKGFSVIYNEHTINNAFLVVVANNQYFGGGIRIAPFAGLQKDKLDVVIATNYSLTSFIKMFAQIPSKKHLDSKTIFFDNSESKLKLGFKSKRTIQIDGEIIKDIPENLEVETVTYPMFIYKNEL
ncbi:MAG: hypothetical protein LBM27_00170, partial [Lactobacillaceae bacterium]|nr:hypothetical protein [Lactobacillaceae bacterium]